MSSFFLFIFYRGRKVGEGTCLHEKNSGRRSWLHSSDPHTNSIENGWPRIRPEPRRSFDSSESRSSRYQSHSRHVRYVSCYFIYLFLLHGWSSSSLNEDRWNNDEGTGLRDQVLSSQSRRYNEDISTDRKQQGDWPYCCARGEQEKQILKERMMNSGRREGERKRVYNIKKKRRASRPHVPVSPRLK